MKMFSSRKIEKTYWALVNNLPQPLHGDHQPAAAEKDNPKASGYPGGPHGRDYEIMQVDEEGQKAVTEYRVLDTLARKFALMELKPLTGRTHQLRVHMAAIGCPILGDHKYGGSNENGKALGVENILHLHARRIVIPSVLGGKKNRCHRAAAAAYEAKLQGAGAGCSEREVIVIPAKAGIQVDAF